MVCGENEGLFLRHGARTRGINSDMSVGSSKSLEQENIAAERDLDFLLVSDSHR
jgi:hypothetical protein